MIESIISGIVQGIAEWLPISSEGILVLLQVNFFNSTLSFTSLINYALFLHLGTFLAALIYFRKEVAGLIKKENKQERNFYITATVISGLIGLALLKALDYIEETIVFGSKGIILLIGLALLITAFLQFKNKGKNRHKDESDLKVTDSIVLGVLQGFSIIPGLSRSGLTISGLLLSKFSDTVALKISFIMSLPIVLAGNIILNLDKFVLSWENLIGLVFSFLFGILSIHLLLKLSKKINFAWFVLIFGLLVIFSAFI